MGGGGKLLKSYNQSANNIMIEMYAQDARVGYPRPRGVSCILILQKRVLHDAGESNPGLTPIFSLK